MNDLRASGYCTEEWACWQQGHCGTYALALMGMQPGLRLGISGMTELGDGDASEGWRPGDSRPRLRGLLAHAAGRGVRADALRQTAGGHGARPGDDPGRAPPLGETPDLPTSRNLCRRPRGRWPTRAEEPGQLTRQETATMPRNVRNVWIEARIDGRDTTLEGGPVSRNGGMYAHVYVRGAGSVLDAFRIGTHVSSDGTITLSVSPADDVRDNTVGQGFTIITHRDRVLSRADVLREAGRDDEADALEAAGADPVVFGR